MLLQVVLFVPAFRSALIQLGEVTSRTYQYALLAAYLVLGLLIAVIIFRTSNSVLRSMPDDASDGSISEGFILQVAGAFFIMSAFQKLAGTAMTIHMDSGLTAQSSLWLAVYSIELLVGLVLLVRNEQFVKILRKLRGRE